MAKRFIPDGLTAQELNRLLALLNKVNPRKPYGTELFDALCRIGVGPSVEAVCLRLNPGTNQVEVYLAQRAPDDTAYPSEWHCPGTFVRPGEDISDVFYRLSRREFGTNLKSWRFVANVNHPSEARGHCISMVYLCELESSDLQRDKWFPVDKLPSVTVETHAKRIIPCALGAFLADNTRFCV